MKEKTTKEARELIVQQHHLNDPIVFQYFYYVDDLSHLDLGLSSSQGDRPVAEALADYFPATFELTHHEPADLHPDWHTDRYHIGH